MSDKDRRKKAGRDKSHDKQAMREGAEFQKREASTDATMSKPDKIQYKRGSAGDRSMPGAR